MGIFQQQNIGDSPGLKQNNQILDWLFNIAMENPLSLMKIYSWENHL